MTVRSLFDDLQFFALFLLAGFVLRELIKPLQKLFLPASVIGGVLALVLGQQCLGLVTVPESFSQFSGVLVDLIMASLVFGVAITKDKIKQHASYSCMYFVQFGMQAGVGILLGALFCSIWSGMPTGWGLLGVYSFNGGHGSAGSIGAAFQDLGVAENTDIGMLMATIGLISAMVVGMAVVNYGIRKGWASFVSEVNEQPEWFYHGALPEAERRAIGKSTVNGVGINAMALQFAILLLAVWVGLGLLRPIFVGLIPMMGRCPTMMWAIVGSCIVWGLIKLLKLERYVDIPTIKQITGLALEIVILTAVSTLSLSLLSTYLIPFLAYALILVALTLAVDVMYCKRVFKEQWFENSMMLFGRGTGVTANGLTLVRAMDPDGKSDVAAAEGAANVISIPFNALMVIWPMMLMEGQDVMAALIGFAIFTVATVLVFAINYKKAA